MPEANKPQLAKRRLWWIVPAVIILALLTLMIWAETPPQPMAEALAVFEPDGPVQAVSERWLVFRPSGSQPATGLILYPGGRVDPRSYAPAAQAIAAEGYLVIITPMPLNLAVLAPDRASEVMAAFPEVQYWALGGHSLGGAMAARFAKANIDLLDGLVLWASYPASGDDLSQQSLPVTSIFGTRDGLASAEEIQASQAILPPTTRWVAIEGGNHAQFGWYGAQRGDNPATISREAQQGLIIEATLALLAEMD